MDISTLCVECKEAPRDKPRLKNGSARARCRGCRKAFYRRGRLVADPTSRPWTEYRDRLLFAPELVALSSPSAVDIAWAAGIYEGEGSIHLHGGGGSYVEVTQVDPWLLYKLKDYFGGKVARYHYPPKNAYFKWRVFGARARGFLLTTYTFLSPRRRAQLAPMFAKPYEGL